MAPKKKSTTLKIAQVSSSSGIPPEIDARLKALLLASLEDPQADSCKLEIAIFAAREALLQERIGSGETGRIWGSLRKAWSKVEAARGDAAKLKPALEVVGQLIEGGDDQERAWQELVMTAAESAKVRALEAKRLADRSRSLPVERLADLLVPIGKLIAEKLPSEADRREVAEKIQEILEGIAA